jgi:hypothetical protein
MAEEINLSRDTGGSIGGYTLFGTLAAAIIELFNAALKEPLLGRVRLSLKDEIIAFARRSAATVQAN